MGAAAPSRLFPSRPALAIGIAAVACSGLAAALWLSRLDRNSPGSGTPAGAEVVRSVENSDTAGQPAPSPSEPPEECLAARQDWADKLVVAAAAGELQEVSLLLGAPPPGPAEGLLDIDANLPPSGQYPNVTAAYAAALHGHTDVLQLLLKAGACPDTRCIKSSQWDGAFTLTETDTALVVACKEGHSGCVESLLAAGADPNIDCNSDYFEGAVEWGDDDDGTEQFFYTALDVTDRASVGSDKDSEHWKHIRELLVSHGGRHTHQLQLAKRQGARVKVTSGSRMGA